MSGRGWLVASVLAALAGMTLPAQGESDEDSCRGALREQRAWCQNQPRLDARFSDPGPGFGSYRCLDARRRIARYCTAPPGALLWPGPASVEVPSTDPAQAPANGPNGVPPATIKPGP